jgi:hypothetical protein
LLGCIARVGRVAAVPKGPRSWRPGPLAVRLGRDKAGCGGGAPAPPRR